MIPVEPLPSALPGSHAVRDGQGDLADRFVALIGRTIGGASDVTFEDLMRSVTAARRRTAGSLDVHQFLADRGHQWQTIECVCAYLAFRDDRLAAAAEAELLEARSR